MSFLNVFGKLKKSTAFEYLSQWFSNTSVWDSQKLQKNISNCLIKLDFQLELANSIAERLLQELKKNKEINESIIKEKLIELLIEHYSNSVEQSSIEGLKRLNFQPNQCNVFFIAGSNGVGKTSFPKTLSKDIST